MPKEDNSAPADKLKRRAGATGKGTGPKGVTRPEAGARAWATANKLPGGGKKTSARNKVPSGPLGGSGRKTNLARSS